MTMKDRFNRMCDMMLHHGKKDDTGAVKKKEEEKEVAAKVEAMIKGHAVVVFSKSWCPHCKETRATLESMGAEVFVVELDTTNDGNAIQHYLHATYGQSSVPNIFIGGEHIGGNSSLQARKAELPALLVRVGAL